MDSLVFLPDYLLEAVQKQVLNKQGTCKQFISQTLDIKPTIASGVLTPAKTGRSMASTVIVFDQLISDLAYSPETRTKNPASKESFP